MTDAVYDKPAYLDLWRRDFLFAEYNDLENFGIELEYLITRDRYSSRMGLALDKSIKSEGGDMIFRDAEDNVFMDIGAGGNPISEANYKVVREEIEALEYDDIYRVRELYAYAPTREYEFFSAEVVPVYGYKDTSRTARVPIVQGSGTYNDYVTTPETRVKVQVPASGSNFRVGDSVYLYSYGSFGYGDGWWSAAIRGTYVEIKEITPIGDYLILSLPSYGGSGFDRVGIEAYYPFTAAQFKLYFFGMMPSTYAGFSEAFFACLRGIPRTQMRYSDNTVSTLFLPEDRPGGVQSDPLGRPSGESAFAYVCRDYITRIKSSRIALCRNIVKFYETEPNNLPQREYPSYLAGGEFDSFTDFTTITTSEWLARIASGDEFVFAESTMVKLHTLYKSTVKKTKCC